MTQHDKRSSEYRCRKLLRDYKKWCDGLEGETCASANTDSSRTTSSSHTKLPTEHGRALPPAAKPESRRNRRVRVDLTEGRKSPEPIQFSINDQAHSISPRQITGKQKGKRRPARRQRSMSRKRKEGRRQNLDGSSNLTTPRKSCMTSKAS